MPLQGVFNLLTFFPGRCPGLGNDMPFQGGQLTPRLNIRTDNGCKFVGGGDNVYIVSCVHHLYSETNIRPKHAHPLPRRSFLLIGATQSTTFSPQNIIVNNQQLPRKVKFIHHIFAIILK